MQIGSNYGKRFESNPEESKGRAKAEADNFFTKAFWTIQKNKSNINCLSYILCLKKNNEKHKVTQNAV